MTDIEHSKESFEAGALAALDYITDERIDLEGLTMRVAEKIGRDIDAMPSDGSEVERLRKGIGCGKFSSLVAEACVPLTDLMQANGRVEQLEQALREVRSAYDDDRLTWKQRAAQMMLFAEVALHPDQRGGDR